MIINGTVIANDLLKKVKEEVLKSEESFQLTVFTYSPNFETQKFLNIKKKKAEEVGISLNVIEFADDSSTEDVVQSIQTVAKHTDGIIVQLPFPNHIDAEMIIRAIPATHDVDAFNISNENVLSPVTGAFVEILKQNNISVEGKRVVVVGSGKLVGIPATKWFTDHGADVTVVTKETEDMSEQTRQADILVLGAGSPGLITAEDVKEGAIVLDAGTSEDSGVLKGDADPNCAEKASLFTPVPGGIGPITVAILLRNLLLLSKMKQKNR